MIFFIFIFSLCAGPRYMHHQSLTSIVELISRFIFTYDPSFSMRPMSDVFLPAFIFSSFSMVQFIKYFGYGALSPLTPSCLFLGQRHYPITRLPDYPITLLSAYWVSQVLSQDWNPAYVPGLESRLRLRWAWPTWIRTADDDVKPERKSSSTR